MTFTVMDWFCGAGGSSQGIDAVPGVEVALVANHWPLAIKSHLSNFPHVRHERGDIRDLPVHTWPVTDGFWASPECTKWTGARGKRRDYDRTDTALPGMEPITEEEAERSRALMWDVPKYLAGVQRRGRLVLFGVVENVVEARNGRDWNRWLRDLHNLGYRTRLIALNSMHAQRTATLAAPQSRDRLYLAYWHASIGRNPDWDKWLRPDAHCPTCDRTVPALQVFKNPKRDMGRYRQSYLYRCPSTTCRNAIVEPDVLPASVAIDPALTGDPIGARRKTADRPDGLKPATIDRIRNGMATYWEPLLRNTGPATVAPLLVPVEGRDGKAAAPATRPGRTQTTRNETGLILPPFVIPLRGGGDKGRSCPADVPLRTVSAAGNHHGYIPPHLLVPYYGNATTAAPVHRPVGALTTRDRYALATPALTLDDVRFRMLEPTEIRRAMAFANDYILHGNRRQRVRQLGNAVTPPAAELLISALTEAVSGTELDRAA